MSDMASPAPFQLKLRRIWRWFIPVGELVAIVIASDFQLQVLYPLHQALGGRHAIG